jgi:uncharacterized protein YukE
MGMDADAVRTLASKLEAEAARLSSAVSHIDGLMSQVQSVWRGTDAQRHVGWWQQQHRPQLVKAQQAIAGLAQSARNNASDQDQASGTAGGPSRHAAPAASPVSAARRTATVAAGAVSAGALGGFLAAHPIGSRINDGECVWVFESYNTDVVKAPFFGVGNDGGAKDFYEHFGSISGMSNYYDKVPASSPPQPGDVVVWGTGVNPYGHIAVVTGVDGGHFTVIEQNAPSHGDPVRTHEYTSMSNVLGYLRPKDRA